MLRLLPPCLQFLSSRPPCTHRNFRHGGSPVIGAAADALRLSANGVFSALFAPECAACGELLDDPISGCVCSTCWTSIAAMKAPVYAGSGGAIDGACAAGEYDGPLRAVVHALKYDGRRSLVRPLATLMRERGAVVLSVAEMAVPVPLHWRRQLRRGFNQSSELARHLGVPVVPALVRARDTRPQVELEADARRTNVDGAFRLRRGASDGGARVCGRRIVLVDDVCTTGATLDACAQVLRRAGALEVWAITAARVAPVPDPAPRSARPIPTAARARRTRAFPD